MSAKPVCAVVGIGPGNGAAIARRYAQEGYAVALLSRSRGLSAELAEELEVGVRTVLRDLDAMRNEDYPIDYDPKRRALFYTEPVFNLPSVQVTGSDLLALQMAGQALEQSAGASFHRRVGRIHRALLSGFAFQDVTGAPATTEADVSFHNTGVGIVRPDVFVSLIKALRQSAVIEFSYLKPQDTETKPRRVRPHFITSRDHLVYLVAQDEKTGRVKSFAISRIQGTIRVTTKRFVRPKNLSATRMFKHAFRIFEGEPVHHVKLRVSRRTAPYIKERRWHASQKITEFS